MEGKVIAITGGASGIGLSLGHLLLSRGATISIADVSQTNLDNAFGSLKSAAAGSDRILTCQCDVRKLDQVRDWVKQTVDKFGKLEGAANLAGVISKNHGSGGIEEQDEGDWDFMIGVNLTVGYSPSSPSPHLTDSLPGRHALHERRVQGDEA